MTLGASFTVEGAMGLEGSPTVDGAIGLEIGPTVDGGVGFGSGLISPFFAGAIWKVGLSFTSTLPFFLNTSWLRTFTLVPALARRTLTKPRPVSASQTPNSVTSTPSTKTAFPIRDSLLYNMTNSFFTTIPTMVMVYLL